jgi:hypothetical protein
MVKVFVSYRRQAGVACVKSSQTHRVRSEERLQNAVRLRRFDARYKD